MRFVSIIKKQRRRDIRQDYVMKLDDEKQKQKSKKKKKEAVKYAIWT